MTGLTYFNKFDVDSFLKDKKIMIMNAKEYLNYETKVLEGYTYVCIIDTDNTEYANKARNLNEGEQFNVKVKGTKRPFKKYQFVKLVNPKATIYGEFRNFLSVKADDIKFMERGD